MPKARRRIPTPAWEREHRVPGGQLFDRSPQFFGMIAVVLLIVIALGIVGYGFLSDYIQTQQRPGSAAIEINNSNYSVRYYAARLKMYIDQSGGASSQNQQTQPQTAIPALSNQLVQEYILNNFAGEKTVTATDADVNTEIATLLGIKVEDANFPARVQEELTRNGLTEPEFRDFIKAKVLFTKLNESFVAAVPATAESVNYRQIQVDTLATADELRAQIEAGADFAVLAKEKSTDTTTKDTGGDTGWTPRGVLEKATEDTIFGLEPGQLTTFPTQTGAFVYQLIEKQAGRPIEESQRSVLANVALGDWFNEKQDSLNIVDHLDLSVGDGDKIRYVVDHAYSA